MSRMSGGSKKNGKPGGSFISGSSYASRYGQAHDEEEEEEDKLNVTSYMEEFSIRRSQEEQLKSFDPDPVDKVYQQEDKRIYNRK